MRRVTRMMPAAETGCIGSWRTRVLLEPGLYRFQALVRTVGVQALTNKVELGNGVGILGLRRLDMETGGRHPELHGDTRATRNFACGLASASRM